MQRSLNHGSLSQTTFQPSITDSQHFANVNICPPQAASQQSNPPSEEQEESHQQMDGPSPTPSEDAKSQSADREIEGIMQAMVAEVSVETDTTVKDEQVSADETPSEQPCTDKHVSRQTTTIRPQQARRSARLRPTTKPRDKGQRGRGRIVYQGEETTLEEEQREVLHYSLSSLLNSGTLSIGDEIKYQECSGYLTRDGWIDCTSTDDKYPSIATWCCAIAKSKGESKRKTQELAILDHVLCRGVSISRMVYDEYNARSEAIKSKTRRRMERASEREKARLHSEVEAREKAERDEREKGEQEREVEEEEAEKEGEEEKGEEREGAQRREGGKEEEVRGERKKDVEEEATVEREELVSESCQPTSSVPDQSSRQEDISSSMPPLCSIGSDPNISHAIRTGQGNKRKKPIETREIKEEPGTEGTKRPKLMDKPEQSAAKQPKGNPVQTTIPFNSVPGVTQTKKPNRRTKKDVGLTKEKESKNNEWISWRSNDIEADRINAQPIRAALKRQAKQAVTEAFDSTEIVADPIVDDFILPDTPEPRVRENSIAPEEMIRSKKLKNKPTEGPVILGTGLKASMLEKVQALVQRIGGRLVQKMSHEVTHLVAITDENLTVKRTIKYACAVLAGQWIVSFDWILASFSEGKWVNEDKFQVSGDSRGLDTPAKSRNAALKGTKLLSGLHFYAAGVNTAPSEDEIDMLAQFGGATYSQGLPKPLINTCDFNQDNVFVLCPSNFDVEEAQEVFFQTGRYPVDILWLLDTISRYQQLPLEGYQIKCIAPSEAEFETQLSLAF